MVSLVPCVASKACREIDTLQRESQRLRSVKICLKQQRDAAVRTISQHSGEPVDGIGRSLPVPFRPCGWRTNDLLSHFLPLSLLCCDPAGKSEDSILQKLQLLSSKLGSLLARGKASAGGGATGLAHSIESGWSPEAPSSPAVALPACPPAQQQQEQQQPSPATSQQAPAAVSIRTRTVPNILSRSRKQAPPPRGEGGSRHPGHTH